MTFWVALALGAMALNALTLPVAGLSLVVAIDSVRARERCQREVGRLRDELKRFESCPCPRLRSIEAMALVELDVSKRKDAKLEELQRALGGAVLAGLPEEK